MAVTIPSNLGSKVVSRDTSWNDLVQRAWGSEFNAPDHNIYKFNNGRGYDSTDRGLTGIYGVVGDNMIYLNNRYPDMRDGILVNQDGVTPLGALNNGFGDYQDVVADSLVSGSGSSGGNVIETDPQWLLVQLLNFGASIADLSSFGSNLTTLLNATVVPISDGTMGAKFAWQANSASDCRLATPASAIWGRAQSNSPFAYTIEYSIKIPATLSGTNWFMSQNGGVYSQATNSGGAASAINETGWMTQGTGALLNGRWYDIALCHDEAIGRIFVNGALVAQQTAQSNAVTPPSQFAIFGVGGSTGFGCAGIQITNVRVTWGYARYGAVYVPRTTPFPTSGP